MRRNRVSLIVFLLPLFALHSEEVYRSNRDFMVLESIEEIPTLGWYLTRESGENGTEERRLYLDGELRGREELAFDPGGRLTGVRRIDGTGEMIFEERYRYRSDESLRAVVRCDWDGECIEIRYEGTALGEELSAPDLEIRYRFGESGRPVWEFRREGGAEPEERWYEYEGGNLIRERIVQGDRDTVVRWSDGLLAGRIERSAGRIVSETEVEYDEQQRLLTRIVRGRRQTTVERYTYLEEGGSVRTVERDGVLEERESFDPDELRTVERYSGGELVSRTVSDGDRVVRRETYLDGELVAVERTEGVIEP